MEIKEKHTGYLTNYMAIFFCLALINLYAANAIAPTINI